MSVVLRPLLKGAQRKFWWGEHDLIDYGVIDHVGTSAWAVYTCLLRHVDDESIAFPSVPLLEAETGLSNRVIAQSITRLKTAHLIEVDRHSHQWNKYIILDVEHAIRKNGWKRVRKKARDESSPAQRKQGNNQKQVTNGHVASDETSPEQMTIRHPKKNQLKKNQGERGVLDVTGDGHVQGGSLSAPVVGQDTGEHSSSTDAALQKNEGLSVVASLTDLPVSHLPGSFTSVLEHPTPDGVAADAALGAVDLKDENLEASFGTGTSTPALEQVPGGAAQTPRDALVPPRALTMAELTPVPPSELASRFQATLESEVGEALREGLGTQVTKYLAEATRTGGLSRELWLKLTPTEIRLAILAAQLEVDMTQGSMLTMTLRALDRLIGAIPRPKAEGRKLPALIGGQSLELAKKPEPDLTPEAGKFLQGARWKPKTGGEEVTLRDLKATSHGSQYVLTNDQQIKSLDLIWGFDFVAPGHGPLAAQD